MRTVFDGEVRVSYMQMYVDGRAAWSGTEAAGFRAGQVNGLCGAAVDGYLFLTTGTHTGRVGVRVEIHDGEPPADEWWEEIVEVSFTPRVRTVRLSQWDGADACAFDLDPVGHRVRYCAVGMDAAYDGVVSEGEPLVDRYLLQFWPAPAGPDRVIRQTGHRAAYRHRAARETPRPPAPEVKAAAPATITPPPRPQA